MVIAMNTKLPNTKPPDSDSPRLALETMLAREFSTPEQDRAPTRSSLLRLQPTVLPPPPTFTHVQASPAQTLSAPASPDDDIEIDAMDDATRARRWRWLLAGIALGITVLGGWAYVALAPIKPVEEAKRPVITPPVPVAPVAPSEPVVPPLAAPPQPAATPAKAEPPNPEQSLREISTELVPPSTEGLSPARRIGTIRIIVKDDREVPAPR